MATDTLLQKERQLKLVLALDKARDSDEVLDDPTSMFREIVQILRQHFEADACAVLLVDETSNEIESIVGTGVPDDMAIDLCRQAMRMETPGHIETARWSYTMGLQIALRRGEYPMGGFFLARRSTPFDEADVELLQLAESQIDSAIIQARLLWKLANRNLELEAIYQIDRMRDENADEGELTAGFTAFLAEKFKADLCMICLTHVDTGELVVRGLVDKRDLSASKLEAIIDLAKDVRMAQAIPTPPGVERMILLAAPLIVAGNRLGLIVVGRKSPFTVAENRLLFAIISQIDSAIVHSRVMQQLSQRNKELEAIYRIDQIRDSENDFDMMLQLVLAELCKAVSSEIGYLMLYKATSEEQLELKATTTTGIISTPAYVDMINRVSREALQTARPVYSNESDGALRSIVAVPLILNDKIIGVFGAINSKNSRGFSAEDRRMLTAITSQVDTAIFERLEKRQMRRVLSRSVDPKVLEHLLQSAHDTVLAGERVVLSVLFGDLRGSTKWAETIDPEELVNTLNIFLGSMVNVIFKHGGTLDKFVGDEVIALFGCPVYMEDHAYRAATAALEMQAVQRQIQAELRAQGRSLPPMGIGISSGEVIAGEFGPPIRTDFTAMGRVMNLGARLCSAAGPEEIYISEATFSMLEYEITAQPLDAVSLKGIGESVPVYKLLGLKK